MKKDRRMARGSSTYQIPDSSPVGTVIRRLHIRYAMMWEGFEKPDETNFESDSEGRAYVPSMPT